MSRPISDLETQLAFSVYESKGIYAILLGSGLSRSASIPTGWEITLDLIRRVGLAQGSGEQADWAEWYRQKVGAEPNYSVLLEELAASPEERRSILHSYIEPNNEDREEGRKIPTSAHHAIADLIADGFIRVVVTTNFDRLMENALRERGIEATIVASVDALSGAEPITHSACYIVKLHGDYKDARILNTDSELEKYPPQYEALLDRIFDEYGLIVSGWSGEWDHALRASLMRTPNRRYPVYWTIRGKLGQTAQELTNHRRAKLITIGDANDFFVSWRERIRSLAQSHRQNPVSVELLISTAKRYLGKPEHRIQLHELFEQETKKLLEHTDSDNFSPNAAWSIEVFRLRLRHYESIAEPLARMVGVLGRWGDDSELPIVLDIVRSLHHGAQKQSAGLNHYLTIRLYPAVLVFTAYGLGLVRAERWRILHQLFSTDIDIEHREPKKAVEVLFPSAWSGGGSELWNQLGTQRLKTPLSDHLLGLFSEWGSSFATLTPDFELLFERFDILGAFAHLEGTPDGEIAQTLKDRQDYVWMPVGRSGWHERNADKILIDLQKEPLKSEIIRAGFAKGNIGLLSEYVTNFRRMAGRMRFM